MRLSILLFLSFFGVIVAFGGVDSTFIKKVDALNEQYYDLAYNNPDSALLILDRSDSLAMSIHYLQGHTCALRLRGIFYSDRSDFVKAMSLLISALKQDEELKNGDGIGMDNLYIGLNYYAQEKVSQSLVYFRKSQHTYIALKDEAGIALANANVGMAFRSLDQFDSALYYYNSVQNYYTKTNNGEGLSHVENNIGNIYKDLKQYDKALEHFAIAKNIGEKRNDLYYLVNTISNIADVYVERGDYQRAIDVYDQAMIIAKQQKAISLQKDVCFDLAHAYQMKGDYKKAFESQQLYSKLKDSTISEKYDSDIAEMKVKYESDKKENENTVLSKENELKSVKITQERKQKILFASLFAIFFLALVLIIVQYRNKQKLNLELARINEKMNSQNSTLRTLNKELIESEENLTQANATKDQLISMLSHDLYNPVTSVINYTSQVINNKDLSSEEEWRTAFKKVNAAVIPLQDLLDNILQWARIRKNRIEPNIESVDLKNVITEIVQLYEPAASFRGIKIVQQTPENATIRTDRLMLYFIIRNVLNNAVKFCAPGKKIEIKAERNEKELILQINDQGKGFLKEIAEKLNGDPTAETITTHGSGIGLSVSRRFVEQLGGTIFFENLTEGASVKITIPL